MFEFHHVKPSLLWWSACIFLFLPALILKAGMLIVGGLALPFVHIFLRYKKKHVNIPRKFCPDLTAELEEKFLQDYTHGEVQVKWTSLENLSPIYSTSVVHSVIAQAQNPKGKEKEYILLVHGTMSSAAVFTGVFDGLSEHHEVHSISLPGFGRSESPQNLGDLSVDEATEFWCNVLLRYMDSQGIQKALIVGHSYGAFLSTHFALKFPTKVTKIVLISCPGMFSWQGSYGAFWGFLFHSSIMTRIFRTAGRLGLHVYYSIIDLYQDSHIVWDARFYYWLQVWSNADAFADLVVGKNIMFSWASSRCAWDRPLLHQVAFMQTPIALLSGDKDNLVVPAQGALLSKLLNVPYYKIKGLKHFVQFKNGTPGAVLLTKSLKKAIEEARRPIPICKEAIPEIKTILNSFHGSASVEKTTQNIALCEEKLIALFSKHKL
eukprot:m.37949 g.37949  ORF g.37949 m.37949 type:complete len:434 (+) comp9376_c0_seq1:382-1683(+)